MKRQAKQIKVKTVDEIIESVPFIVSDIASLAKCTCIDMRDRGYWELVGRDFMDHFSRNRFGKSERYQWETRCPDGLLNLWIWSIA